MNNRTWNSRELAILSEIELADEIAPSAIARRLKLRTHTVRHSLSRLREGGVFTRGPFIDIHRLGLRWCGIFMSILGDSAELSAASRFIANHPSVGWFAELHGSFSIGVALAIRSPRQVDLFLKDLTKVTNVSVYKKSIAFRLSLLDCPRQYLSPRSSAPAAHYIEDGVEEVLIDSTDRRILRDLTNFPESSTREMGSRLGMPHTTVDLRVRKLRANRVLIGNSTYISPERLGRQLQKLLIFTRDRGEKLSLEMKKFALYHPNVSHFIENIGGWDFEYNIETRSLSESREFENALREKFDQSINDIVTLGVSKVHSLRRFAAEPASTTLTRHTP